MYSDVSPEIGYSERIDRKPYIPISTRQDERFPYKFETPLRNQSRPKRMPRNILLERKIDTLNKTSLNDTTAHKTYNSARIKGRAIQTQSKKPHFHVTYWMFYPYNQVRLFLIILPSL